MYTNNISRLPVFLVMTKKLTSKFHPADQLNGCGTHMGHIWHTAGGNGLNSESMGICEKKECFASSPRRPYFEDKRMVLEHTHGLFIT